jgi:hypothetical protein
MTEQANFGRSPLERSVSRRTVLLSAGGAIMVVGLGSSDGPRLLPQALSAATAGTPTATLHLVRPQDMLVLDFDFYNLAPTFDTDPPQLRRVDSSVLAYVVVRFESQHVMEQTILEDSGNPHPTPGTVRSKGVGPSRIVFAVPETVKLLPYTEEGLLRWWQWIMQVPTGLPNGSPPDELHTDLLLVDWLHLTPGWESPEPTSTWAHSATPVTRGDRTELWHTRLSPRGPKGRPQESIGVAAPADVAIPKLRAVYRDQPVGDEASVYRDLLPPHFVDPPTQIVQLAGNPTLGAYKRINANLLALSAVGATLDFDVQWIPTVGFELKRWEHHTWLGRDNKVVVEQYGFLFPFGHRAELISETKREVDAATGVAYLKQRLFIRITERVKTYAAPFQNWGGRAFPFTDVTIKNTTLPDLPEKLDPLLGGPPDATSPAFWIQDINSLKPGGGHSDVVFAFVATDVTGRRIEFTSPMAFMPADPARNTDDPLFKSVLGKFGTYADIVGPAVDARRVIGLRGQTVAYAKEETPGTASFPTIRWYWGVEGPRGTVLPPLEPGRPSDGKDHAHVDSPVFYPRLLAAEAQVPAVDAIIGTGGPVFLMPDPKYLEHDFGFNKALVAAGNDPQIFVRVQDSVAALDRLSRGDRTHDRPVRRSVENSLNAGGVATPHMEIGGLSRISGVALGLQDSIDTVQDSGKIKFDQAFPPNIKDLVSQAGLFGEIALGLLFDEGNIKDHGPRIRKVFDFPKDKDGHVHRGYAPVGQTITMTFEETVTAKPPPPFKSITGPGGVLTRVSLVVTNQILFDNKDANTVDKAIAKVDASVTDFKIDLTPIVVTFNKFVFSYQLGPGAKCDPDIKSIELSAPLDFLSGLMKLIGLAPSGSDSATRAAARLAARKAGKRLAATKKFGLGFKITDFDTTKIGVGVSLNFPDLALGLFTLEGIHVDVGVILPFSPLALGGPVTGTAAAKGGPLRASLGFGAPADKFKVSVYGLGGGGHFLLEASTRRLEKLEASIEVIGNVSLDLVVAAGRLLIELGVFFSSQVKERKAPDVGSYSEVQLGGYMRATGRLSVLGLINITAELYADIEYVNVDGVGSVWFHAHLTVSIDITFWHVSVGIEFTKVFGGGSSPSTVAAHASARALTDRSHTFGDLMSRDDWALYCASFAG